jgi:pimeloyl-ACP methyl ester carboxylesterase
MEARRHRARLSALLLAFAMVATGCGSGSSSQSPASLESASSAVDPPATTTSVAPTVSTQVVFDECKVAGVNARCATVLVPETRSPDDDVSIPIRVVVVEATAASPPAAPLVLLSGGPGGSAVNDAPVFLERFAALRPQHDFVFVEQRGTGTSGAVLCDPLPLNVRGDDSLFAEGVEWASSCLTGTEADVTQYGTAAFVDDLDDILGQLGYETAHVYGGSYGALAAQVLAIRHPGRVASMTLDGVSGLGVPIIANIPRDSQRALELLAARCAADAGCHAAYPDPIADVTAVLDRLRATPVELAVADPATGTPLILDDVLAAQAIHALLLSTDTAPSLPGTLRAAALGIDDYLGAVAERIAGATEVNRLAMYVTIRCSEPWASPTPDTPDARSYLTAAARMQDQFYAGVCSEWPLADVAPAETAPPATGTPILLLVGEADPQNPPSAAAAVAAAASNTFTVIAPGHGHGIVQDGCVSDVVATFVGTGTIDDSDRACVAAMEPPPFVLPPG